MSPMMQKAGNCIPTSFHNMANRNRMAMNEDHFMSGGMGMSGMGGMGMGGMGPAMMGMPGAARLQTIGFKFGGNPLENDEVALKLVR